MSTATEPAAPAAPAHDASAAGGGGKGGMVKLIGIVAVVMVLEGVGLYFVLGKGSGHAAPSEHGEGDAHGAADAHGGGHGGGHGGDHGGGHGGGHGDAGHAASDSETAEVTLESIMTTNNRAAAGSIIHMTFRIVCIVPTAQKAAFEHAINEENRHRVRETILRIARSASMEDMSDPDLGTMKRLFREEINKTLRKSFVIEVVISDFKTIEQ